MSNHKIGWTAIVLASLLWFPGPAASETVQRDVKEIAMRPGFAIVLNIGRSFKTAVVGDSGIADIAPQNDRVLTISGKRLGTTNLIVLDAEGREVFSALLIVGARDIGRVHVHTSRRDLHAYTPFHCTQASCVRVRDDASSGRTGGVNDPIISYQNVRQDVSTDQPASASVDPTPTPPVAPGPR